ncbi:hypothetical protein H6F43_05215 [Leptolyngbya sp. FACHB-36]|nr:hypothetical protein [Leptolyngbya sp. FACHB-36]
MVWAAISIARSQYSLYTALAFVWAIVCSLTAGNPQESFFGIVVTFAIFIFEITVRGTLKKSSLLTFALSLASGLCLGSPGVVPYLVSRSQGLLNSVGNSVERSTSLISIPWLFGWIIPYINGPHLRFYRTGSLVQDAMAIGFINPIIIFLLIFGVISVVLVKNSKAVLREKILFFLVLLTAILGIVTISQLSPFTELIRHIPFVNTTRITKYINCIYLLIGICAAISLNWLIHLSINIRRRVSLATIALILLLCSAIVAFQVLDPAWQFNMGRIEALTVIWLGFLLSMLACAYLLSAHDRPSWKALLITALIAGLLTRPYGFPQELNQYTASPWRSAIADRSITPTERVLSTDPSNTNLLKAYESITVFDPILNKPFAELMNRNFRTMNPFFSLQPDPAVELSQAQMNLLKLLGVTLIDGYKLKANTDLTQIGPQSWKINQPLPRIFLVQSGSAEKLQALCSVGEYSTVLNLVQQSIVAVATGSSGTYANKLPFKLSASGQGELVALQSYTPAWQLNGQSADRFCNVFSYWRGSFTAQQLYEIVYNPPGLNIAYWLFGFGSFLLLLAGFQAKSSSHSRNSSHPDLTNS